MRDERTNYGLQREYSGAEYPSPSSPYDERLGPPVGPPPGTPAWARSGAMSVRDERTWSVLAHLTTFLNVVTGFLGPVVAGAIWLAFRNRSPEVASHALRSVFYQVAWLTAIVVGWTVTGLLMAVVIGIVFVPVMILVTLAPFVQAAYEAYRAYRRPGLGAPTRI